MAHPHTHTHLKVDSSEDSDRPSLSGSVWIRERREERERDEWKEGERWCKGIRVPVTGDEDGVGVPA